MNYIKQKVILEDAWVEPQDHTLETVTAMYGAVVTQYLVVRDDNSWHQRRDPHMKWQTMVQLIRKRMRAEQILVLAAGGGGRGGRRGVVVMKYRYYCITICTSLDHLSTFLYI